MIDLHCHYLPGVDDGAPDLQVGLGLARAAVSDGIRLAVLTPHVHPPVFSNTRTGLKAHFAAFRRMVTDAGIPLRLRLGAEVRLSSEALALLDADGLPTLGRWRERDVLLLEMPDAQIPQDAMRTVERLLARGIAPMLAHPERNKAVMRDPDRLRPFVEAGCLVQLTAAAVCGGFGRPALRTATRLLEAGWVTAIATDAHNLAHRPPCLREARRVLRQRYGDAVARRLTEETPAEIVGVAPADG